MDNLADFVIHNGILEEYRGAKSHVWLVIPEGVVEIDAFLFENMQIEHLSLPSSLRVIGEDAFAGCPGLFEVVIPEGVITIGDEGFCECEQLQSVTFPSSCRTIGERAFGCTGIKEVTIPEGVVRLGDGAFGACTRLKNVTLPASLTEIGEDVFCEGSEKALIHAPEGSFALKYAKQNGLKCEAF